MYFILLFYCNWHYFLLFSECSLQVHRHTTGFCMLILYPEALLYLLTLIVSLMDTLGFSVDKLMSTANRDNFIFFLPGCFSFSCPMACLESPVQFVFLFFSIVLNSSYENGNPCFVSPLRGKYLVFYH